MTRGEGRHRAFIGLGSNVGDRLRHLRGAVAALEGHPDIVLRAASAIYESAAHTITPGDLQEDYFNAVVEVSTGLNPDELLELCHEIERAAGRDRGSERRWAPRKIDLDILIYGSTVRGGDRLKIPHPYLAERRFVLVPLAELAPDLQVPDSGRRTVEELLESCPDEGPLRRTGLELIAGREAL